MVENAVTLQLLLGLTTGDGLFLNSKSSGGFGEFAVVGNGKEIYRHT